MGDVYDPGGSPPLQPPTPHPDLPSGAMPPPGGVMPPPGSGLPPPGGELPPGTGVPPPADPDARWRRALLIGLGLAAAGILTVVIVFLVTRGSGSAPAPLGAVSPSAPASPSGSASPSASPAPSTDVATAGPSPTAPPPPTATAPPATAAPTPARQSTPAEQATALFPSGGPECGAGGNYGSCPVTPQLVDSAHQWTANHNPGAPPPLCRCPVQYQNPFAQRDDTLLPAGDQGNPNRAAVKVSLSFPAGGHEEMVVLFSRQADGTWLADDTYCGDIHNRLAAKNARSCVG